MAVQQRVLKPYKGMGMEGPIAKWYAALTKKSAEDFRALAQRAAQQLPPLQRAGSRSRSRLFCH